MNHTDNKRDELGANENRERRRPNIVGWFAIAFVMYCLSPILVGHLLNKLELWEEFGSVFTLAWWPLDWCYARVPAVAAFYDYGHRILAWWI